MKHAFSRSTWAYAAILFAVLFAPHVAREPLPGQDRTWSLFPDGFTFLAAAVIQFLAVRQAMAGNGLPAAGIARGCAVAGTGAVLYAIGSGVVGQSFFTTPGFAWMASAIGLLSVAIVGSLLSVAFAFALRRRAVAA